MTWRVHGDLVATHTDYFERQFRERREWAGQEEGDLSSILLDPDENDEEDVDRMVKYFYHSDYLADDEKLRALI